jgi:hypothetical protein
MTARTLPVTILCQLSLVCPPLAVVLRSLVKMERHESTTGDVRARSSSVRERNRSFLHGSNLVHPPRLYRWP